MPKLIEADGPCPTLGGLASSCGRVGHLTELGMDGFTRRLGVEMKNRERYPEWVWKEVEETDHRARAFGKLGVHIIKRNHHQPLAMMTVETLLWLLDEANRDA